MITPRPTIVAEATARNLLQHVTHEKVTVSMSAGILAGLLAGLDELAAARAKLSELQGGSDDMLLSHLVPIDHFRDVRKMVCRCGPDGCADSTCPGKCSGVAA